MASSVTRRCTATPARLPACHLPTDEKKTTTPTSKAATSRHLDTSRHLASQRNLHNAAKHDEATIDVAAAASAAASPADYHNRRPDRAVLRCPTQTAGRQPPTPNQPPPTANQHHPKKLVTPIL
ncbi:hypothetical protein PLESTM_000104200 [Pleodorina starrii]|nr:hypothetical protein PLESTM_000104200 [Pleodorina starrii]